jgi:hypothetical protein
MWPARLEAIGSIYLEPRSDECIEEEIFPSQLLVPHFQSCHFFEKRDVVSAIDSVPGSHGICTIPLPFP